MLGPHKASTAHKKCLPKKLLHLVVNPPKWFEAIVVIVSLFVSLVLRLQPSHQIGHQILQLFGPQPPGLQDLLMVGFLLTVIIHHCTIAYQRQGEATHPSMTGNNDFMDGAHPFSNEKEEIIINICLSSVSCYNHALISSFLTGTLLGNRKKLMAILYSSFISSLNRYQHPP